MSIDGVPSVAAVTGILRQILSVKRGTIQSKADLDDADTQIARLFPTVNGTESRKKLQWPVVETACRNIYNRLVVSREWTRLRGSNLTVP